MRLFLQYTSQISSLTSQANLGVSVCVVCVCVCGMRMVSPILTPREIWKLPARVVALGNHVHEKSVCPEEYVSSPVCRASKAFREYQRACVSSDFSCV